MEVAEFICSCVLELIIIWLLRESAVSPRPEKIYALSTQAAARIILCYWYYRIIICIYVYRKRTL